MTAVSVPAIRRREAAIPKWVWFLAIMAVAAILYVLFAGDGRSSRTTTSTRSSSPSTSVRDWIRDNRDNLVYFDPVRASRGRSSTPCWSR